MAMISVSAIVSLSVVALITWQPAHAQRPTTVRFDLRGKVASVKERTATYSERNRKWREVPAGTWSVDFDQDGRATRFEGTGSVEFNTAVEHGANEWTETRSELGALVDVTVFKTDTLGRLTEWTSYDAHGAADATERYSYAASNLPVRVESSSAVGGPMRTMTINYDSCVDVRLINPLDVQMMYATAVNFRCDNSAGSLIIETKGSGGGATVRKEFDSLGRPVLVNSRSDGSVSIDHISYDRYGNQLEVRSEGSVAGKFTVRRFEYQYDKQGNWTKRTERILQSRFGKDEWVPLKTDVRHIRYY